MKKRRSTKHVEPSTPELEIKSETVEEKDDCGNYFPEFVMPVERPKYICSVCQKSFSDKNCLKKHIKKIHQLEPEPLLQNESHEKNRIAPFKCRVCETEFAYKRNLKRHLIKYHSQGLEDEEGGNCFCNVEGCKFRSFFINALRTHLHEAHKVQIDVESKVFPTKSEFDSWKEEEEKANVCLFIKEAGKHTLINGDQRLIYQCHRSGHYSGHGNGKRSFRIKGTCKLGKRCTAGIELTVKNEGDVYEVVYYKTHIWHTPDVAHVNLSASERAYLANKLREGASIASILESVKADKSAEGTSLCKRIHLLKRKDLVNIENTFRLNNTERHLRKQHKKGQKLDRDKIKKNLDDYGEVVSWVMESPANVYEYFTVKRLQREKCVGSCGVVCTPCNACLHMYSCTCHDYLLYGTMCQHIHSIALTLLPVQKAKRISKSAGGTATKRKRKNKAEQQQDQHVIDAADTEHKESDIINFLTKNLELQREQELLHERIRLKEKVELFQNIWIGKMDQLNEISVQQLAKLIDAAIDTLNEIPCPMVTTSMQHMQQAQPTVPNTSQIPVPLHHASAGVGISQPPPPPDTHHNIPKEMVAMNPSLPAPQVAPTSNVVPIMSDRKYELPPQYYAPLKKKRKLDETAAFYRSPAAPPATLMDKRTIYENIPTEHNLLQDNYATFDCNLSWQTTAIPAATAVTQTSATVVGGKWWA